MTGDAREEDAAIDVPAGGATMSFWTSYDTEADWDAATRNAWMGKALEHLLD